MQLHAFCVLSSEDRPCSSASRLRIRLLRRTLFVPEEDDDRDLLVLERDLLDLSPVRDSAETGDIGTLESSIASSFSGSGKEVENAVPKVFDKERRCKAAAFNLSTTGEGVWGAAHPILYFRCGTKPWACR